MSFWCLLLSPLRPPCLDLFSISGWNSSNSWSVNPFKFQLKYNHYVSFHLSLWLLVLHQGFYHLYISFFVCTLFWFWFSPFSIWCLVIGFRSLFSSSESFCLFFHFFGGHSRKLAQSNSCSSFSGWSYFCCQFLSSSSLFPSSYWRTCVILFVPLLCPFVCCVDGSFFPSLSLFSVFISLLSSFSDMSVFSFAFPTVFSTVFQTLCATDPFLRLLAHCSQFLRTFFLVDIYHHPPSFTQLVTPGW